jgi:E3 ubiquitin-protein ligase TRIP12
MAATKSKMLAAGPSQIEHDDVDMIDDHVDSDHGDALPEGEIEDEERDEHEEDEDDEDDEGGNDNGGNDDIPGGGGGIGGLDENAAMAIFGDYRQLGSYMMGLSSRLKSLLNNIKPTADPTTRLVSLQELSELLSISTEDTLAGSFPAESYIRELVKILGGTGVDEDDDGDDEHHESDEDASLAAALALSTGGAVTFQGDDNLEAQVLACRCLANLMEALPGIAHTVVYHGAIPVLCSKLIEISYIDLAEQTLSVSTPILLLSSVTNSN